MSGFVELGIQAELHGALLRVCVLLESTRQLKDVWTSTALLHMLLDLQIMIAIV